MRAPNGASRALTTQYRPHERNLAMLRITQPTATAAVTTAHPLATAGRYLTRYGLVVVIAWIGALKYTSYEAAGIQPLIAHSPVFSWIYEAVSVRTFAAVLGTVEIIAALLIAIRPLSPRLSAVGSAMGVLLFASTLSFLFTTPGATAAGGFPVLSVLPGQFLLKDLVLAGAALWTLGDSLGAAAARRAAGQRR
jgi:reactive chlorine resistance protein C